jgi:tetratricopeptide (TPR) repeat protein
MCWPSDHEGALRLIERAISMRPGDMNLRLRHANLLCGAERWRDALVIFEAAVKKLPDNASLLKSTGIAAQMSGQLTRASELYIRALAQGTVDRDVYSNLIAALIELGRIDEAHRHASAWLSGACPPTSRRWRFLALLEVECGNARPRCRSGLTSPASSRATR